MMFKVHWLYWAIVWGTVCCSFRASRGMSHAGVHRAVPRQVDGICVRQEHVGSADEPRKGDWDDRQLDLAHPHNTLELQAMQDQRGRVRKEQEYVQQNRFLAICKGSRFWFPSAHPSICRHQEPFWADGALWTSISSGSLSSESVLRVCFQIMKFWLKLSFEREAMKASEWGPVLGFGWDSVL